MNNLMREPKITKITLSAGATGENLEKAAKLLETISGMKVQITRSGPTTRIPAFGVKPKMELGARVTIRGEKGIALLRRLLGAINNTLKKKQISKNTFSFGIAEYIEIPDMTYIREIGIIGFNAVVTFERRGVRVRRKKIKMGKLPEKQHVTEEEIIKIMEEKFKTNFV